MTEQGQQLEIAAAIEGFHHALEGLAPIPFQPGHGFGQGHLFAFGQLGPPGIFQPLAKHIQIPGQARAAGYAGETAGMDPLGQQQGRGKYLQARAQAAQADAQLVQSLGVLVGQHRMVQLAEAPHLLLNQTQGQITNPRIIVHG